MTEFMPIQGGKYLKAIPMELLNAHEEQAQRNHGQTLRELASRGGLDCHEALQIMEDRKLFPIDTSIRPERSVIILVLNHILTSEETER